MVLRGPRTGRRYQTPGWSYTVAQFQADLEADLAEYRAELATINIYSRRALRLWYSKHPYLRLTDLVLITGLSYNQILTAIYPAKPIALEVPPDWRRNPDWLREQLAKHGTRKLAAALGRSRTYIQKLQKRHKLIKTTSVNPCSNADWLVEHFCRRQESIADCARAAGVTEPTLKCWLARHGILQR